jgi:hypothetical protein
VTIASGIALEDGNEPRRNDMEGDTFVTNLNAGDQSNHDATLFMRSKLCPRSRQVCRSRDQITVLFGGGR